jgi:hypothetical protein
MLRAQKRKRRRPGFLIGVEAPGPPVRSACAGDLQLLYALPRPLLSSAWAGLLRILEEPTYRLYSCQRCRIQVGICQRCDHGNIYCAGECSELSRRKSRCRAQARYQRTRRGALLHAARQRAWRKRREQTVTDHGCAGGIFCGNVSDHPIVMSQLADADFPNTFDAMEPLSRCAFCRTPLPAWARIGRQDYSG